ncbi:hypothetical protein J007_00630 [Cryptococcus neoformans]|nr:hypothetical protein J007_00630 [Cryptococcus neoformans var. grubii]OXC65367.1 hypothetical protein C358_00627 [Cryptococcus neoformans var. grubii MW-RSA852]
MPLAVQSRRSRWDLLRMTTDDTQHQPGVKRKRLSSSRQQAKLEKIYSGFLERFGPRGLFTPFGVSLIAPKFREAHRANGAEAGGAAERDESGEEAKDYLDGSYGSVIIPEEILRGVAAMRDDWHEEQDDTTRRSHSHSSSSLPAHTPHPTTNSTMSERPTAAPINTHSAAAQSERAKAETSTRPA